MTEKDEGKETSDMKDKEPQKDKVKESNTQVHEPQQVKESGGESLRTKDQPILNLEFLEKFDLHTKGWLEEGGLESMDRESQDSKLVIEAPSGDSQW